MNLDDERKPGVNPETRDAEERRTSLAADDDLLSDVEFDLIPEDEVSDEDDVFARDTAIPASPPEQLAAEAMRRVAADEGFDGGKGVEKSPRMPPPLPPVRRTPVTLEPPPAADLEFENFDTPIDVFGQALPGARPPPPVKPPRLPGYVAESEVPTAPPGIQASAPLRAKPPAPSRAERAAFLAETSRNRPIDPELLARASRDAEHPARGRASAAQSTDETADALEFLEGLDPMAHSLAPMANLGSPAPPSSAARPGAKELEESYALGDYSRALQIAEDLLARSPDNLAARRYAQNCRDVLTQMFTARIGPLDQVITVMVSPEEVQWLSLDHRAGFLLSLVDGQSTVDEILDISGMSRLDALKIIHDLAEQRVVRLS